MEEDTEECLIKTISILKSLNVIGDEAIYRICQNVFNSDKDEKYLELVSQKDKSNISDINMAINLISTKFDTFEKKMDEGFSAVNSRLDALDDRLNALDFVFKEQMIGDKHLEEIKTMIINLSENNIDYVIKALCLCAKELMKNM